MATINFPTVRLNSDNSDWTDNDPLQDGDQITRNSINFEWNGSAWIKLTVFDLDRIPDLPTSKITSGVFDVDRIPDLTSSKITNLGTSAIVNTGTASGEIALLGTNGVFDTARLASGGTDNQVLTRTASGMAWEDNQGITQTNADTRYLQLTGGTITRTGNNEKLVIDGGSNTNSSIFKITTSTSGDQKAFQANRTEQSAAWISFEGSLGGSNDKPGIAFGPGTGSRDVNIYRDGANILRTDDTFRVAALNVDSSGRATSRTNLGLGTVATLNTGSSSGNIAILGTGGVFATTRIPNLSADKITSGTIASARFSLSESDIPDLSASKITTGTIASDRLSLSASDIPNLAANKITSGIIASARLSLSTSDIPNLATSKITTGIFDADRIPNLDASKITSGTIASARLSLSASDIPDLAASKITSGTFSSDRFSLSASDIPSLSASKITTGTIASARLSLTASDIPNLDAGKITTGTIANARLSLVASDIPSLAASKITTGTISSARLSLVASDIPNISADKLTSGTVASARLSLIASDIPNISANKITSDTFNTSRIPNLDANKITSGVFNIARLASGGSSGQVLTRGSGNTASWASASSGDITGITTSSSSGLSGGVSSGTASLLTDWNRLFDYRSTDEDTAADDDLLNLYVDDGDGQRSMTVSQFISQYDIRKTTDTSDFTDLTDTPSSITANQFLKGNSAGDALIFATLSASDIGSGTFDADRIPNLDASKITSGTIASARLSLTASDIPNISATKITSGTIASARLSLSTSDIPNLATSKITTGTFDAGRIPNLAASKITSGTFSSNRIPNLAANKITSGTFNPARLASGGSDNQVLTRTASGMAWEDAAGGGVFTDGTDGVYYNGSKNVGIGLTNPTHKFQVEGSINASGEITAYSDERLKENIQIIENPIDKIMSLRGVLYNKIGEEEQKIGLIAQEVQEVVPQVIKEGEYLSISYGNLVGLLIEAIKEQETKINRLEDLINASNQ